jgi:phage tail-like protein
MGEVAGVLGLVGKPDPLRGMKFQVFVPDIPALGNMGFSKISGIGQEAELIEYREGDESLAQRKIPGLIKTDACTLARGVALVPGFHAMLAWKEACSTAMYGSIDGQENTYRHNVHIQVLNRQGLPEFELVLVNAWPRKMSYGDLDANASDIWLTEVEFVYEALAPGSIPLKIASIFEMRKK